MYHKSDVGVAQEWHKSDAGVTLEWRSRAHPKLRTLDCSTARRRDSARPWTIVLGQLSLVNCPCPTRSEWINHMYITVETIPLHVQSSLDLLMNREMAVFPSRAIHGQGFRCDIDRLRTCTGTTPVPAPSPAPATAPHRHRNLHSRSQTSILNDQNI